MKSKYSIGDITTYSFQGHSHEWLYLILDEYEDNFLVYDITRGKTLTYRKKNMEELCILAA